MLDIISSLIGNRTVRSSGENLEPFIYGGDTSRHLQACINVTKFDDVTNATRLFVLQLHNVVKSDLVIFTHTQ